MERLACRQSSIVVVDPRPQDYEGLLAISTEYGCSVHCLPTARAAIRLARTADAGLWLINAQLPDMSGIELYETLREVLREATACIVSNAYDRSLERSVCRLGAAVYLAKTKGVIECEPLFKQLLPVNVLH